MDFVFDLRQIAAIFDFTHSAMSQVLSDHTLFVGQTGQPYGRHINHERTSILSKMISIYYLTLHK